MTTFLVKMVAALTATMTLVAGVPHFDCLCPNGRVKQLCLTWTTAKNPCCCGGACCSASGQASCCQRKDAKSTSAGGARLCCAAHQSSSKMASSRHTKVAAPKCCDRKLAETEPLTVSSVKATAIPDQELASQIAAFVTPVLFHSPAITLRDCWQLCSLGPPTDLVIVLQHFLI